MKELIHFIAFVGNRHGDIAAQMLVEFLKEYVGGTENLNNILKGIEESL